MNYLNEIPVLFIQLLLTTVFSLVIGLEQRKHHPKEKEQLTFGSDRTFTFIGLLGFALLVADLNSKNLYIGGGLILGSLLGIFYFHKIKTLQNYGLTTILLALLTYVIPLVVITQLNWLAMLFFVVVLILAESKGNFGRFSQKIDRSEFITLAKFLLNLFQGKYNVTALLIGLATFQAMASNNVLKLGYGIALGDRQMVKYLASGFGLIILTNIAVIILLYIFG